MPRRGRPTPAQAADITRAIIAAATENFLANGFERASLEAIAARANIPRSTLYNRYPQKTDLLHAVLQERLAAWSAAAEKKNRSKPATLDRRLKFYLAAMIRTSAIPEIRAFMQLARSAWPHDAKRRMSVLGLSRMIDVIEQDIRELGSKQKSPAKNPRRLAETIMILATGWCESGAPEGDAEAFAESATDILLHGRRAW